MAHDWQFNDPNLTGKRIRFSFSVAGLLDASAKATPHTILNQIIIICAQNMNIRVKKHCSKLMRIKSRNIYWKAKFFFVSCLSSLLSKQEIQHNV